ncbi:hypothetical protein H0H87_004892 [Tephrocybe sp. NHM501043]|nr:hypothetical protein H0H87_004892 [Tephrocybe sp. NHM501043]
MYKGILNKCLTANDKNGIDPKFLLCHFARTICINMRGGGVEDDVSVWDHVNDFIRENEICLDCPVNMALDYWKERKDIAGEAKQLVAVQGSNDEGELVGEQGSDDEEGVVGLEMLRSNDKEDVVVMQGRDDEGGRSQSEGEPTQEEEEERKAEERHDNKYSDMIMRIVQDWLEAKNGQSQSNV